MSSFSNQDIPTSEEIREIFEKITEFSQSPVPIGTRCESQYFYRVQDLNDGDLDRCALFVANRLLQTVSPLTPELLLKLPGGYSFFAERLAAVYNELHDGEDIPFEQYLESKFTNGFAEKYRGKNAVLITDVITTARSSLETHTKATLRGIKVICWATLIDRTLGPGPVSVVSALTGAQVRVLSGF